jgi:hypothetical protein
VQIDGLRHTVNYGLSPAQTTWNLRSALNVAALNCLEPQYEPILTSYKGLLKTHARGLSAANRTLESEFRLKFGPAFRDSLDNYMTQVYNYFALPAARHEFCEASLGVSNELALVAPADLDAFAMRSLPRLESVFQSVFVAYDQYRTALGQWNALYGPPPAQTVGTEYANPLNPGLTGQMGPTTAPAVVVQLPPSAAAPSATAPAAGQPVIVLVPETVTPAPTVTLPSTTVTLPATAPAGGSGTPPRRR